MAIGSENTHDGRRLPPAIVLGRGHTGLGTLRCLSDAGIETYVACPHDDLVTHSRWYRPVPGNAPWDGSVGAQALRILQEMPLDRAVLIPGADNAALWLSDLGGSALQQRFMCSSSSRKTLEILQDKRRFGEFLASTDIPHPRTFAIASHDDIVALPYAQLDRVFLKPIDSQSFSEKLGIKGLWANGAKEIEDTWKRLDAKGFKVIVQEYVPGNADDHYFVDGFRDRDGRLTGLFARRRTRIFPPDFGNSSYSSGIPLAQVQSAIDSVTKLLAALEYRGIFSAEFKQDPRNGEFRILEVNTRAWWYVEFAARCGVNVCEMAYLDALGEPVPTSARDYRAGVGCVNFIADLKSVIRQPAPKPKLSQVLRQWMRAYFHVFRGDDPMPFLWSFSKDLRRWSMKLMHKLAPSAHVKTA